MARLALLTLGACGVAALGLVLGSTSGQGGSLDEQVLALRGLRTAAAALVGAGLAVGGAAVQGLFRNPLASPSILGTTAGANLGGQLALMGAQSTAVASLAVAPDMWIPIGCVVGALFALGIVLLFVRTGTDIVTLLLVGFVLSSLFLSMSSFVTSLSQESWALGRAMVGWTLGSVSGTGVRQLLFALPLVLVGSIALWGWGSALDVLLSGEDEAASLGVDVVQVRRWVVVWVALLTGAAVSVSGGVAFVGLIAPHIVRPWTGPRHRRLIPACAVFGALFLMLCDIVCRIVPSQSAIPLGVVTGLIGAPVFLWLLVRYERGVAHD